MKITCNKLPENTQVLTPNTATDAELGLAMMYELGKEAQKRDPEGCALVHKLMLTTDPNEQKKIAAQIRKHFGLKTAEELKAERARVIKKEKKSAAHFALDFTCSSCMRKIGYRRYHGQHGQRIGICFTSEFSGVKNLQFGSLDEVKQWLIKAEAWDEKMYTEELNSRLDNIERFS